MPRSITQLRCRHRQQRAGTPDLVLAVGQPLPGLYQVQRPADARVKRIDANPYRCTLTIGDDIWIPDDSVFQVIEGDNA